MKKVEFTLTFLLGLICGVVLTRFLYGAALDILMGLLVLTAVITVIVIIKLKVHKKTNEG